MAARITPTVGCLHWRPACHAPLTRNNDGEAEAEAEAGAEAGADEEDADEEDEEDGADAEVDSGYSSDGADRSRAMIILHQSISIWFVGWLASLV